MKTRIPPVLITIALVCFAVVQNIRAVSPVPDGAYPGGNTAEGQSAFLSLTSGGYNTAVGWFSLKSLTTGSFNTGVGAGTLVLNTGNENTATGVGALLLNTTGGQNTAAGAFTLFSNTTGVANAANGFQALFNNTTGSNNTATGIEALANNTTSNFNTADGDSALRFNTTGNSNTATGDDALRNNTIGSNNIALGAEAGVNLTTGDYNIDIGNVGVAGDSNTIRIGDDNQQHATFIGAVYGVSVSGVAVVMDSSDHLGTVGSSRRFKKDIKAMEQASETILSLKPVTFHYRKEIDPKGIPQFGLVAEEVEKVNPDLVVRDKEGKPYSVRYDAVNAMLLNEFLKEHRKVEEQETTIAQLKSAVTKQEATAIEQQKEITGLTTSLKEQAAQIQKVSTQVEMSKPAPQTVGND